MLQKFFSKLTKTEFNDGKIAVIAKSQRLNLAYDGKNLTSDIAIHTAVLINGRWHSSVEGLWNHDRNQDILSITIDWKNIPIRHILHIKKIKEISPDSNVIIMTAYGKDHILAVEVVKERADTILYKPFDMGKLSQAIEAGVKKGKPG